MRAQKHDQRLLSSQDRSKVQVNPTVKKKSVYIARGTKVSHSPFGHSDLLIMEVSENPVGMKVARAMRTQN